MALLAVWELVVPGEGRRRLPLTAVPSPWPGFSQLEVPAWATRKDKLFKNVLEKSRLR